MACFANINVSQGSVATYARCRGIFNTHLTANLPMNLPVKNFVNRLRFDRLWPRFMAHPVYLYHISLLGYCRLCTKATWPNTPLLDMHRPLLAVITQSLYSVRSTYHPFQRYDGGPTILKRQYPRSDIWYRYTGWAKKRGHKLSNLNDIQNFSLEDSLVNLQLNAY